MGAKNLILGDVRHYHTEDFDLRFKKKKKSILRLDRDDASNTALSVKIIATNIEQML